MTNPPAQTPAAALAPVPDPLDQAGAGTSSDAASAAGTAAVDSMAEIGESERDPVGEAEAAVLSTGREEEQGKEPAAAATAPNGIESKKDA
jgi:hypothetical protein